jgi:hypothetical protein
MWDASIRITFEVCSPACRMENSPPRYVFRRRMMGWRLSLSLATAFGICLTGVTIGCRSTTPEVGSADSALEDARSTLLRSLSGDMAALYRLRVPSSGGLRLSVLTAADQGRITISEPFGSAVSLTAWSADSPPEVFDLRERCRFTTDDLSGVLGVGNLPLPQAVRLLAGRLPAVGGDTVEIEADGRFRVISPSWTGLVTVAPDPWRVTVVEELPGDGRQGWRLRLKDHTLSVPGWLRVKGSDGRWAELELVRLEWSAAAELPEVPELALCGSEVYHSR